MPRASEKGLLTSPSFLQNVLASAVEAELSDLQVETKELEKNTQLLTVEVYEDLTGRYINFDKFVISDDDYLHTAQKCIQDLESINSRIADGQIQTDVEDSTQELKNLQNALKNCKTAVLVVYQLLSIDCALKSVTDASEKKNFLDAAICYSKIPPMFHDISASIIYQDLFNGLKNECNIQCRKLNFNLAVLWKKTVTWHETGESLSSKTKSVSLKVMAEQEVTVTDIVTALYYVGTLHSTVSAFGMSLLKLVLVPIMKKITAVRRKDSDGYVQLSVEISTSMDKPPLSMVITNLVQVFKFLNEEMNVALGSGSATMNILGALISDEFSKIFLKTCLTTSSMKVEQDLHFSHVLEELRILVEYFTDIGFLQCDYLNQYVRKLIGASDKNPAFWQCATFLESARMIMKQEISDTFVMQQNSVAILQNGYAKTDVENTHEETRRGTSFAFPACRVSKWVVDLVNLLQEVLKAENGEEYGNQSVEFSNTARRIVGLYAAVVPVLHCSVAESLPLAIALFHNNTMFLAQQLVLLGFDDCPGKHSGGSKLISYDLIQYLRSIAVGSLLKYLKQQRSAIVEKTKRIDLPNLSNSCVELEKTVKQCISQAEHLHSAWKHVLPTSVYAKAMGGIMNAWLEELIKLISTAERIPGNIARNIKLVYKDVADRILALFEDPSIIGAHLSRWSKFENLIDILDSSLIEIELKWSNGTLSRVFGPQHVQSFIRVLFEDTPTTTQVMSHIK